MAVTFKSVVVLCVLFWIKISGENNLMYLVNFNLYFHKPTPTNQYGGLASRQAISLGFPYVTIQARAWAKYKELQNIEGWHDDHPSQCRAARPGWVSGQWPGYVMTELWNELKKVNISDSDLPAENKTQAQRSGSEKTLHWLEKLWACEVEISWSWRSDLYRTWVMLS